MLSAMMTTLEIRRNNDPESVAGRGHRIRNLSAPCGGCEKLRAASKGAQQKE
jgi:hypothetical protein